MKTKNLFKFFNILVLLSGVYLNESYANSETQCGDEPPSRSQKLYNKKLKLHAEDMGLKLRMYLGENAERVALVSRAGGDLSDRDFKSPERQKYTHTGIAIKDSATGKWKFIHVLNDCAGPTSSIHNQGLAEFFMDYPFMFYVHVIVPSLELQSKIAAVLEDKTVGKKGLAYALHNYKYSNIAYPFANEYQNSNMWVLAVVAAAQSGSKNLSGAVSSYKKTGFKPSYVKLSGLESTFGPMFTQNAKTEDHTDEEKSSGWFQFVSSSSLITYMKTKSNLIGEKTICHKNGCDMKIKGNLIPAPSED